MPEYFAIYQLPFPLGPWREARGKAEYFFAARLHTMKYKCEDAAFEFSIPDSKHVEGIDEKTVRFEVLAACAGESEQSAYTPELAWSLIYKMRKQNPTKSVTVRFWHWETPVSLPPIDRELRISLSVDLRKWHLAWLNATCSKNNRLDRNSVIRGILSGVLEADIDFSTASSEHEVANVMLDALGKPPKPLPETWEYDVVFQFSDGGDVVLIDLEK